MYTYTAMATKWLDASYVRLLAASTACNTTTGKFRASIALTRSSAQIVQFFVYSGARRHGRTARVTLRLADLRAHRERGRLALKIVPRGRPDVWLQLELGRARAAATHFSCNCALLPPPPSPKRSTFSRGIATCIRSPQLGTPSSCEPTRRHFITIVIDKSEPEERSSRGVSVLLNGIGFEHRGATLERQIPSYLRAGRARPHLRAEKAFQFDPIMQLARSLITNSYLLARSGSQNARSD